MEDLEGNDVVLKLYNEEEYISTTNNNLNFLVLMSDVLIEQGEIESTEQFINDLLDELIYDYTNQNISTTLENSFIEYCNIYGGKKVFEMIVGDKNCYKAFEDNKDFEKVIKTILNRQNEYLVSLESYINKIPQCSFSD